MKILAFFSLKGGVGKTTLIYHLAWIYKELGLRVIAVDLDPLSSLTTTFLPEERLQELWTDGSEARTILGAVRPPIEHTGDAQAAHVEDIDGIDLILGHPGLAELEEPLGQAWSRCLDEHTTITAKAIRTITAPYQVLVRTAQDRSADVLLVDLGAGAGALIGSALIAADSVVVPVRADMISFYAMRALGPSLKEWRLGWAARREHGRSMSHEPLPAGRLDPIGYVLLQPAASQGSALGSPTRWPQKISTTYRESVLGAHGEQNIPGEDPDLLAVLRENRSLMMLAQEAHKPMFALKPADGAVGSHARAVADAYQEFERLARRIAERSGIDLPV